MNQIKRINEIKAIFVDLQDFIKEDSLKKVSIVITLLEDILIKNIYKDEELANDNKELIYSEINEDIKKSIIEAYFFITNAEDEVKVYLDDKRPTPNGFIRAFWPEDVQSYIKTLNVTELSLDHDLGDDEHGTGNDVVCYIEELVYTTDYKAPKMSVHSDNSSARAKMMLGINNIKNKQNRK